MNQEEITVVGLIKRIESGEGKNIQLKNWQLAQLFGVYESTIRAGVKAIIKNNTVKPDYHSILVQDGRILLPEAFGLDMIVALSFRIDSAEADKFQKWVIDKLTDCSNTKDKGFILFPYLLNNPTMLN